MVAQALVLTSLTMMALWTILFGELDFLAPYRDLIVHSYLRVVVLFFAALAVNLFSGFYYVTRVLFLKDTGSKLAHLKRQLRSAAPLPEDPSKRFGDPDGPRS